MSRPTRSLTHFLNWLQIVLATELLGLGIALYYYLAQPSPTRFKSGVGIAMIALVIGILIARDLYKIYPTDPDGDAEDHIGG